MVNLIKAEFFRLGKGNAVRNVLLAGVVIIIITGLNMFNSGGATGGIGVQSAASTARSLPVNGADFIQQMRDDGLFPFFILAFATAVLGADYSTGTIRNTLSYFANRRIVFGKVHYWVSLLLSVHYRLFSSEYSIGRSVVWFWWN